MRLTFIRKAADSGDGRELSRGLHDPPQHGVVQGKRVIDPDARGDARDLADDEQLVECG